MSQPPKFLLPAIATVLALGLIPFAIVMGMRTMRTTPEQCKAEIEKQFGLVMVKGGDTQNEAAMKAAVEGECRSQSPEEVERLLKEVAAQVLGNMFGGVEGEGAEGETYPEDETYPEEDGANHPPYTEEPTEEPIFYTAKKSDWKLTTKTLDKSCYGDGLGCNVGFRINVEYVGTEPLPERGTVELTYTIKDENSDQIGTLEVQAPDGDYSAPEDYVTTGDNGKVKIKVTDAEYNENA